jgi:hypothetical protein
LNLESLNLQKLPEQQIYTHQYWELGTD